MKYAIIGVAILLSAGSVCGTSKITIEVSTDEQLDAFISMQPAGGPAAGAEAVIVVPGAPNVDARQP